MFTNVGKIPLSLAVWLADDDYDHSADPKTISATSLLKPIKATVLAIQNKELDKIADISMMVPSRMGTALHSAIERSWDSGNLYEILESLGYPDRVIENVLVNPKPEDINSNSIVIYMEQRAHKKIGEYTISGKFDFVLQGRLEDFKSTGVYNYISGSNKDSYMKQGSIYKWLNPQLITEDHMLIQYIFTDWNKLRSIREKGYPKSRLVEQKIELMSLAETEKFITDCIYKIVQHETDPQDKLPVCTRQELWQKDDVFKYYKNPLKKERATKNFDTMADAQLRLIKDGNVGVIDTYVGEVIRCRYCNVVGICDQAQAYINNGLLTL